MRIFPRKKLKFLDKLRGRKQRYQLAGAVDNLETLYQDRKLFYKWEASCAFGLSHMYDTFSGAVADYHKHKDFYFSLFGQNMPHNSGARYEAYYPFCNNVNKDLSYLMNGIIPLISHTEHNVYKEMVKRKMAILIKKPEDVSAALKLSDQEIQTYRDNIYKNRVLFTFDHVGEMLLNLLTSEK